MICYNKFNLMEKIQTIFKKIGLTETETALYLAGLEYSTLGVSELEKQTRIKRTTIYHAIETLMQKGLASKVSTGARVKFTMTKPENIKKLIEKEIVKMENRKNDLDEIIPLLQQKTKINESDVRISHFEGIEGIKLVVEEALYCKSRKWDIIAPTKNFFSEFDTEYARYYISARKSRGIISRSLWEYDPNRKTLGPETIKERNPRYLPAEMYGKFN